jgi:hypothetical protein
LWSISIFFTFWYVYQEKSGNPSSQPSVGGGVPVEVLRRLAHFLILQASGQLSTVPTAAAPAAKEPAKVDKMPSRKRGSADMEDEAEVNSWQGF